MALSPVLLGMWLVLSGVAAVYMQVATPGRLPATTARKRLFLVNSIACIWGAVGVIAGYPLGWYAALLHECIDAFESFWPDTKKRPRWAVVANVSYGLLSLGAMAILFLPSVRRAFGLAW